jgi:hypothetical protein
MHLTQMKRKGKYYPLLNNFRYFITVTLLLLQTIGMAAEKDSLVRPTLHCKGSTSAAITGQQNWYGNSEGAISLNAGLDLRYKRKNDIYFSDHRFRGEIGYLKPQEDQWRKNNDLLRLSLQWFKVVNPGWKQGFSARLNTQWLSTWKITGDNNQKKWTGGFMNPFSLDCSYDFIRPIFKNSRLMLSLATLSLSAIPRKNSRLQPEDILAETQHAHIRSRYGCSLQLFIDESFRDNTILLDHQSSIIANELSRDGIHIDLQNRVCIKLFRYLQLRLDTRIIYEPQFSYKMQYRQEVLLGIFYEAGH